MSDSQNPGKSEAAENFESMLSGGHPNSLGRTLEVVGLVLESPALLRPLFDCYRSDDAVVRMRTSNALKRITRLHPEWIEPFLDRLLGEVAAIDQDSTRWTLATLFRLLESRMRPQQRERARVIMQTNLDCCRDWIVLNTTMETLADWAQSDSRLKRWLLPRLQRLAGDSRKSVARKAVKMTALLTAPSA